MSIENASFTHTFVLFRFAQLSLGQGALKQAVGWGRVRPGRERRGMCTEWPQLPDLAGSFAKGRVFHKLTKGMVMVMEMGTGSRLDEFAESFFNKHDKEDLR